MIKKEKGITLLSLVITLTVMMIVASSTVYISLDRFQINRFRKMENDIEFLQDKVSNYYLKYGGLPIIRKEDKTPWQYTYSSLEFEKNNADNSNYYILDLEALGGALLNYGKSGFENINESDDVYIINELTHTIYYPKGVKVRDEIYYYIKGNTTTISIPPSKPQIKVISGEKKQENVYITDVKVEIVPGRSGITQINKTTYSVNGSEEIDITTLDNNIYNITQSGTYEIIVKSYDMDGNVSSNIKSIEVEIS